MPLVNPSTGGSSTATGLSSATTTVNVSSATAPVANQVLTATSGTAATWQTAGAGSAGLHPTFNASLAGTNFSFGQTGYYGLFPAEATKTITKAACFMLFVQASSVLEIGMYDMSNNLLGSGTVTTTSTVGMFTVTMGSSFSVTAGTMYWYALLNRTAESTTQSLSVSGSNNAALTFSLGSKTALDAVLPTSGRSSTTQNPWLMYY